jgi:hypothetical protein
MLGRSALKQTLRTTMCAFAVACLLNACASNELDPSSDSGDASVLLDDTSSVATEVTDGEAFADLKTDAAPAQADDGAAYYSSVGGESLRRVAVTLYSDKSFARKLLEKNPDLRGVKQLSAEQRVYFDLDTVVPEPKYLTKDLLDRYPEQLAERVNSVGTEKGIAKTTVTVNKGETLQELSLRLYGTHRYWTEIFLVNHDKIRNYDKVKAGMTLSVFDRSNGVAAEAAPHQPKVVAQARTEAPALPPAPRAAPMPIPVEEPVAVEVKPEPTPLPTQPEPMVSQVPTHSPPPVADPIPETPPVVAKDPEPVKAVANTEQEITSSNSITRPIIYGLLVLLIIGGGIYFTRTPKRSKVDMLDITAADSVARPKLSPKDSQKTNIG